MKTEFIIGIRKHKTLGFIASGYMAEKKNNDYYNITEPITLSVLKKRFDEFSENQKEAVKIIENYSATNLTKIFSKGKSNVVEFIKNIDEKLLSERVRPFIEKNLVKVVEILKNTNIKVFHKADVYTNVYISDQIKIHSQTAHTVFNIIKEKESTKYFLSVGYKQQKINLTDKVYIVLSNNPCIIIIQNDLFIFDDIDAKKLIPFFDKSHISIPKSAEKIWFEKFALKAINQYDVNAEGFSIEETKTSKKAILSLEKNWDNEFVFVLKFRYNDKEFLTANIKKSIVSFDLKTFKFTKLIRDFEWENSIVDYLLSISLKKCNESNFKIDHKSKNKEKKRLNTISWLNKNNAIFKIGGIELQQAFYNKKYFTEHISTDIKIEDKKDWFDIYGTVKFGNFEIPFIKLRKNILNGEKEFQLPDESIAIIPEEWFAKYSDIFLFSGKDKDKLLLKKIHFGAVENVKDEIIGLDKKKLIAFQKISGEKAADIGVVKEIRADLRPYQKEGLNWLYLLQKNDFGACLADDMGLGKTLQAISLIQQTINDRKKHITKSSTENVQLDIFSNVQNKEIYTRKPSLVVSPVSLIHNWENEIIKFSPFLKVLKYRGSGRHRKIESFNEYDLILTGYGVVRNDAEILLNFDFLYIILDESQFIKNPDSKIYKAVNKLSSEHKLILTGTPIENSLMDLWAQMNFINHGILGSRKFFKTQFQIPVENNNDKIQHNKLKKIINPFVLRRTKDEVAKDLPLLTEQTIYCSMSKEQKSIYESEKSKIRNKIIEQISTGRKGNNSILIIQALTKLRQTANHPKLTHTDYEHDSGKFNEIIRTVENILAEKHKLLIFSSFVKHLNLFAEYFNNEGIKFSMLTGSTPDRENVIKEFQEKPQNKIFLISIKAGGTGLNLTEADYVIILDPWWNPAVEKQAINRPHRIGQNKNVFVYKFISKNTVEEKIKKIQKNKQILADSLITTDNPLKNLSEEKLLTLFE